MDGPRETNTNQAGGHARVKQQIGHIDTYIRKVVHEDHSVHYENSPESPEKMFAAAKEYLAAGASMKAAGMMEDARARGYRSTELAYYWQVAVLAGQPFDHLSPRDLMVLEQTRIMSRELPPDNWVKASEVVEALLQCFTAQVQNAKDYDGHQYDEVMSRYTALPEPRRDELGRHLAPLFSGGLQDRLDHERREQIRRHRMSGDRRRRVPKFFEPDPAEPRLREPAGSAAHPAHWIALGLGAAAYGYGAFLAIDHAARVSTAGALVYAVILGVGSIGAAVVAPGLLGLRAADGRRRRWATSVDTIHDPEDLDDSGDWWWIRSSPVDRLILEHLLRGAPEESQDLARCLTDLEPQLDRLSDGLARAYPGSDGQEIDWLIRWHVQGLLDAWRSGAFDRREPDHRLSRSILWSSVFLVGCGTVGLLSVFGRWAFGPLGVMLAVVTLMGSGVGGLVLASTIYAEWRRIAAERVYNDELLVEERAAWERERQRLLDRPSDIEMAEWLDYDKDHVRLAAMRQWGLGNWDVVAHVVLTEPGRESASARVRGGPRRYSRYLVRLFLLTNNGVRHLDVQIDFAAGAENNEQRNAFRYDAIASAQIEEPTVRRFGRRQVASADGGGSPDHVARPIRRQKLHLTLLNGESVDINADYESLLADEDRDDKDALLTLEMETSGAVSTLRTLESVAGEGREWLRKERDRTEHVAGEYRRAKEPPVHAPRTR